MTKNDLLNEALKVARTTHERSMNLADMGAAYDSLMEVAAAELLGGGEIPLTKIGKLKVKEVAPRNGRNPRTGEIINIPAGKKVVFAPGKEFREALKG